MSKQSRRIVETYCVPERYNRVCQATIPGAWVAVFECGMELAICRDYEASTAQAALEIYSKRQDSI